jgi:hypothetical protein
MTREQQIDWLCRLKSEIKIFMPYQWQKPFEEALDMSIKALEQEPKSEWEHDHEILKAYSDGANEVLDKIYTDIQKLRGCSCSCSDGIIDDVEDILDKYKGESEG